VAHDSNVLRKGVYQLHGVGCRTARGHWRAFIRRMQQQRWESGGAKLTECDVGRGRFDGLAAHTPGSRRHIVGFEVCHRAEGTAGYKLLTLPAPALDAHMRHGDGLVGEPVPAQPGMKFSVDCVATSFVSATITFSALANVPNLSAFSGHSESGFVVDAVSGSWLVVTSYGRPAPSIQFQRLASESTISAAVRVTAGGTPFVFRSADLYSSVTQIPYTFTGFLGGSMVYTVTDTVPNTFGNFVTVTNPEAAVLIDALTITLSNPATSCCSNPVGIDNIVLSR
jgi:hypothetical protein